MTRRLFDLVLIDSILNMGAAAGMGQASSARLRKRGDLSSPRPRASGLRRAAKRVVEVITGTDEN